MNFMDMVCNLQEEEVTQEQIEEARRHGEREGRLRALNQLKDDQRKELRKREYLTYIRINKASAPPSQPTTPSIKKMVAPLPPPIHKLLPNPTPIYEIQLNIDVA
jgi:hypothetical protein